MDSGDAQVLGQRVRLERTRQLGPSLLGLALWRQLRLDALPLCGPLDEVLRSPRNPSVGSSPPDCGRRRSNELKGATRECPRGRVCRIRAVEHERCLGWTCSWVAAHRHCAAFIRYDHAAQRWAMVDPPAGHGVRTPAHAIPPHQPGKVSMPIQADADACSREGWAA